MRTIRWPRRPGHTTGSLRGLGSAASRQRRAVTGDQPTCETPPAEPRKPGKGVSRRGLLAGLAVLRVVLWRAMHAISLGHLESIPSWLRVRAGARPPTSVGLPSSRKKDRKKHFSRHPARSSGACTHKRLGSALRHKPENICSV
jgi:hypothetical protein